MSGDRATTADGISARNANRSTVVSGSQENLSLVETEIVLEAKGYRSLFRALPGQMDLSIPFFYGFLGARSAMQVSDM